MIYNGFFRISVIWGYSKILVTDVDLCVCVCVSEWVSQIAEKNAARLDQL